MSCRRVIWSTSLKGHDSSESSLLQTDDLETDNGVKTSKEMEGDETSDTESKAPDIMDNRDDLLACRGCGLVFAQYQRLENHNCRRNWFWLSGEALEGCFRRRSTIVCCQDDLRAYLSYRPTM